MQNPSIFYNFMHVSCDQTFRLLYIYSLEYKYFQLSILGFNFKKMSNYESSNFKLNYHTVTVRNFDSWQKQIIYLQCIYIVCYATLAQCALLSSTKPGESSAKQITGAKSLLSYYIILCLQTDIDSGLFYQSTNKTDLRQELV